MRVKDKEGNVLKEGIKADIEIFVEDKSENKKPAEQYFQHQTAMFWPNLRQMLVDETKLKRMVF